MARNLSRFDTNADREISDGEIFEAVQAYQRGDLSEQSLDKLRDLKETGDLDAAGISMSEWLLGGKAPTGDPSGSDSDEAPSGDPSDSGGGGAPTGDPSDSGRIDSRADAKDAFAAGEIGPDRYSDLLRQYPASGGGGGGGGDSGSGGGGGDSGDSGSGGGEAPSGDPSASGGGGGDSGESMIGNKKLLIGAFGAVVVGVFAR